MDALTIPCTTCGHEPTVQHSRRPRDFRQRRRHQPASAAFRHREPPADGRVFPDHASRERDDVVRQEAVSRHWRFSRGLRAL